VPDHHAAGPPRRTVLGIAVDPLTMAQAVERCAGAVERGQYLPVGVVNAAKVVAVRAAEAGHRGGITGWRAHQRHAAARQAGGQPGPVGGRR